MAYKPQSILIEEVSDEQLLGGYDARVEELYLEKENFERNGITRRIGHYEFDETINSISKEIERTKRLRNALIERMKLKTKKQIWYKDPDILVKIILALIGALATVIAAWIVSSRK
ncbi:MAG TPA: hypothetical protein VI981_04500 [Candidatus Paceibacterota bacterium]